MKYISLSFILLVLMAFQLVQKPTTYKYNAKSGKCLNEKGKKGLNPLNLKVVQQTKNCECMDLGTIDLVELLPDITDANKFGYNKLKDFNFRGANLSKAKLHFNDIENADFSGAIVAGFSYGYAHINGKIDKYTVLPDRGAKKGDQWSDIR